MNKYLIGFVFAVVLVLWVFGVLMSVSAVANGSTKRCIAEGFSGDDLYVCIVEKKVS